MKNKTKPSPQKTKEVEKQKYFIKPNYFSRYSELIGLIIIVLLGFIIYSNSFNCSFQFDDFESIVNNKKIQNIFDIKAWWNFSPKRPISIFTFALNYHFHQIDVKYYHYTNLLIHLLNACLIWFLTKLIFSTPNIKSENISQNKSIIAFFTALLFVSHPLATQSVTYIVQRQNSLATLFYLLSLICYIKYRIKDAHFKQKLIPLTGVVIFALLAFFTKENAYTLPVTLFLVELFFIQKFNIKSLIKNRKNQVLILGLIAIITVTIFRFSLNIFKPIASPLQMDYVSPISPMQYLFTQFNVIVKYFQLLIFPIEQNLDYNFPISRTFFEFKTILNFTILLSIIALGIYLFNKNRIISFGIFWIFITLSIESSIVPIIDVINEHRTYLPSVGFFLILATTSFVLFKNKNKYLAILILSTFVLFNSYLTIKRNTVWKTPFTLWNDVALKSPNKARPHFNRGIEYFKSNQYNKAIADYDKTIQISPNFSHAYLNRALAYERLNLIDNALADYEKAIKISPNDGIAYFNRGVCYSKLNQYDKAIVDFSKNIEIQPTHSMAYFNRGKAFENLNVLNNALNDYSKSIELDPNFAMGYFNRGIIFSKLGDEKKAVVDFNSSININNSNENVYLARGCSYFNLKIYDKAIADFTSALNINPNNATTYSYRGNAYNNYGKWNDAINDYDKALSINPNLIKVYCDRGITYGNLEQWEKAVNDFEIAVKLDPIRSKPYIKINQDLAYKNLSLHKKNLNKH